MEQGTSRSRRDWLKDREESFILMKCMLDCAHVDKNTYVFERRDV